MAVYIYSDNSKLAAELVAFAKGVGLKSAVLAMGCPAKNYQGCGADTILDIGAASAENYAKSLADYLKAQRADLFLAGATVRGRDVAARVAGYLKVPLCADVSSIIYKDGSYIIERMMYGGAVVSQQKLPAGSLVTVNPGCFEAASGQSEIRQVALTADTRAELISSEPIPISGEDLSKAKKVVSVGMGIGKEEDLDLFRRFAKALDAHLACSRGVAEERHWLPVENHVGISGNIISPDIYIACAISGQIQHIYGIRDAKIIVGINNNEKAPIFRAADYGIVGDVYQVVPALMEELQKSR